MTLFKRLGVNAGLFCLVSLVLAGAAEAVLWGTGCEVSGYVTRELYGNINLLYRPNSRTRWRGNLGHVVEFDTPITTNSLAQFDREHSVQKPDGCYRLIVTGDSFVEALQVPLEEGFARRLEDALNRDPDIARSGKKIEVIKFGSSGSGALKTYETLMNRGFGYDPDLVLAFFTDTNDLNDDWYYFRRRTGKEIHRPVNLRPADTIYEKINFYEKLLIFPNSRLNRWIAFKATEWRENKRRDRENAQGWKSEIGVYAAPGAERFAGEEEKWREAFQITAVSHLKMRDESVRRGAEYAVVLNDRPQTYQPDAYRYLFKLVPGLEKEVDLDRPAKFIKTFLKTRGIEWLDLNEVFRERALTGQNGHYKYDGHWNPSGHRWTAEVLTPFVKERVLRDGNAHAI